MIGAEIAAVIWPIVKIGIPVLAFLGLAAMGVRSIRKGGEDRAHLKVLRRESDARIRFELDRSQRRQDAVDRLRRIRARLRRPNGPGGNPT